MTRPPVSSLLPPRERALLADVLVKVRQLVEERRSPLAWDTLRLVEQVEYASLLPRELGGAIRATFSAGLRDRDRHALETIAECVESLDLFRLDAEARSGPLDRPGMVLRGLGAVIEDLTRAASFLRLSTEARERDDRDCAALRAAAEPFAPRVQAVIAELQAAIAAVGAPTDLNAEEILSSRDANPPATRPVSSGSGPSPRRSRRGRAGAPPGGSRGSSR